MKGDDIHALGVGVSAKADVHSLAFSIYDMI